MALPAICSPRSARLLLSGSVDLPTLNLGKALNVRPEEKKKPIYFPGMTPLARPWRLAPWRRAPGEGLQKDAPVSKTKWTSQSAPQLRVEEPSQVSHSGLTTAFPPPPVPILKRAGDSVKRHDRHVSFGDVSVKEYVPFVEAVFSPALPVAPALPAPILKRAGDSVKRHDLHVSFGNVVVSEYVPFTQPACPRTLPTSCALPFPILEPSGDPVKRDDHHISEKDVPVNEHVQIAERVFPPPRWAFFPPQRLEPPHLPSPPRPVEDAMDNDCRPRVDVSVPGSSLKDWAVGTACCVAFVGIVMWLS